MTFFTQLETRAREHNTLLCVGLDPHPEDLPQPSAEAARAFCLRLIEATAPYALAFKPNAAFFEIYGAAGWQALREVIAAAQATGAAVILDAKRGDIASTARAYARAAFHGLHADALTVNPYLGHDAVAPFLEDPARGVFLLCKTSNPGSADLQDVAVAEEGGQPLYLRVARLAQAWNTRGNLGLVVGATHPEALRQVRQGAPDLWFLAPGVGAQGGNLEAALQAGLRADGLGMLIAVSRGISRAAEPAQAARALHGRIASLRTSVAPAIRLSALAGQKESHKPTTGETLVHRLGHEPLTPPPSNPPSPLPHGERQEGEERGASLQRVEGNQAKGVEEAISSRLSAQAAQKEQRRQERRKATPLARQLRRRMTVAEQHLWQFLRAHRMGVRWRRQHPVGPYILDFYCPEARLAVEVDGGQHAEAAQRYYDTERTRFLEEQNIQVLRFWNDEVLSGTEQVLTVIWEVLVQRLGREPLAPPPSTPPSPLPTGERGGGS